MTYGQIVSKFPACSNRIWDRSYQYLGTLQPSASNHIEDIFPDIAFIKFRVAKFGFIALLKSERMDTSPCSQKDIFSQYRCCNVMFLQFFIEFSIVASELVILNLNLFFFLNFFQLHIKRPAESQEESQRLPSSDH